VAHLLRIIEKLSGGKGEVLEEIYRDTATWTGWTPGFTTDDLPLSFQTRNVVDIQERHGGVDGEGENLAGLEWCIVIQVEIAPRQADIPNNPIPLMYFSTFRIPSLIMNPQRDEKTIVPSSFHGGEHIILSETSSFPSLPWRRF
jgi:hypothetical protein